MAMLSSKLICRWTFEPRPHPFCVPASAGRSLGGRRRRAAAGGLLRRRRCSRATRRRNEPGYLAHDWSRHPVGFAGAFQSRNIGAHLSGGRRRWLAGSLAADQRPRRLHCRSKNIRALADRGPASRPALSPAAPDVPGTDWRRTPWGTARAAPPPHYFSLPQRCLRWLSHHLPWVQPCAWRQTEGRVFRTRCFPGSPIRTVS